jgi:hypothetical protein
MAKGGTLSSAGGEVRVRLDDDTKAPLENTSTGVNESE